MALANTYKDKDDGVLLRLNGSWVSWAHTIFAYVAFFSALAVGLSLHYDKIVTNQWYGYPQEWFPSVSATIGDRYPERSLFQIFVALTSGPRFALIGLWYLLTRRTPNKLPVFVAAVGVFRTFTCGGWTYVTSTDDHDSHDVFMIAYLVATIPWTFGCIALSPHNPKAIRYRKYVSGTFYGAIVPLVYFYIQHKVHRVPGAYTAYAFFEWSLILLDVSFDAITVLDFDTFEIIIRDRKGITKGTNGIVNGAADVPYVPSAVIEKQQKHPELDPKLAAWSFDQALDIAADVYHGFVFWSVLTSLGLVVWYFPLWYMGISGYEVLVMSTLSPALLAFTSLRRLLVGNQLSLHLLSLAGLAAFLVKDPVGRLFMVGFGVFMQCLAWSTSLIADVSGGGRLESRVLALVVGLLMSTVIKFIWQTNNPIWPVMHAENGGWNFTGLILAIPAVLRFSRDQSVTGSGDSSISKHPVKASLLSAISFGGLMFGLHSLLSDSSTMILWTWQGFPIQGPTANTSAWATIFAMTAGLMVGMFRKDIATSWVTFAVGCAGAAVLTAYQNWLGYAGGLATAFYLMAVATPLLGDAATKNPAVAFGLGFFVYNILVLFHVWVVAYAFVPGGPLVREHTDWIMATMMSCIGLGILGLPSRKTGSIKQVDIMHNVHNRYRKYHLGALGMLNIMFLAANFLRFPTYDYAPSHPDSRLITAGIWTVHFSLDNDMWSSEIRMRDLLKELEVDVVGLLESDLQRIIMGNRDTTQFLAEDLGMYVDYGPGPNKHTWGSALLSKFPIVNSTHHLLPSPKGELAPAIEATIDAYGTLVDVFVFHSGQEEDPEDRLQQTVYLSTLMGSTSRPAILLSYLVTKPLEGNYNLYTGMISGMNDVDPTDWDRWCEYILYKGMKRVGYARVSRSTITDTELQVAKFVVPRNDDEKRINMGVSNDAKNQRVNEEQVPYGWRFPEKFKGEGVRGHRYHVFDEPRYYDF